MTAFLPCPHQIGEALAGLGIALGWLLGIQAQGGGNTALLLSWGTLWQAVWKVASPLPGRSCLLHLAPPHR